MNNVKETGYARIDLLGGTLDLWPINQILPKAYTLAMAIDLTSSITLLETPNSPLCVESKDYKIEIKVQEKDFLEENLYDLNYQHEIKLILFILNHFQIKNGLKVILESKIGPHSGLGGSSVMAVTLYKALTKYKNQSFSPINAIKTVMDHEVKILNRGPAGYQDYYPSTFGGINALIPKAGSIEMEQLYSAELSSFLQNHLTLINSNLTHHSGVNNWSVFKEFFDGPEETRKGLKEIATLSAKSFQALKDKNYETFLQLIAKEGELRTKIFPDSKIKPLQEIHQILIHDLKCMGVKPCGSGGGGHFIVVHPDDQKTRLQIKELAKNNKMLNVDFNIVPPLLN